MARKAKWPPNVTRHSSGQARVYVRGETYYLGVYGSPEAQKAYEKLLRDLSSDPGKPGDPRGMTVAEACIKYLAHATQHYRHPSGEQTSQMGYVKKALEITCQAHARTPAADFRAKALKIVREKMISLGWCRRNVNQHVAAVRRAWKWLASEELVPVETYQSLATVAGLAVGRTEAPDPEPIKPVEMKVVEDTLPHLSPHLQDAVWLQLHTACRPGEALACRPEHMDMRGDVWVWKPAQHKTSWRGKERVILIGPKGQAIVESLLRRCCPLCGTSGRGRRIGWQAGLCGLCAAFQVSQGWTGPYPLVPVPGDYYLLSPVESEDERLHLLRIKSRVPRKVQTRRRDGHRNERFSVNGYAKRIRLVCERLGIPHWHPGQLRHTAGTVIRETYGVEIARILLGHASLHTTEIYAEMDLQSAMDAIRKIG